MNLQDLLMHMQEVGDTLNSKGYFDQPKAMSQNFARNFNANFPAIAKQSPAIEDLVATGLNIGGVGSIKGQWKLAKDPALRQSLKDQGFDLTQPWYHGGPNRVPQGRERLPMWYTATPEYAKFMATGMGDGAGVLHKVLAKNAGLLNATKNEDLIGLLDRAKFKYIAGTDGYFESIDEIPSKFGAPYTVDDPVQALYHPKVQRRVAEEGYNGVKVLDMFDDSVEPTAVFTSKPEVYELSARKVGSSAQLRKLYKNKPLKKALK